MRKREALNLCALPESRPAGPEHERTHTHMVGGEAGAVLYFKVSRVCLYTCVCDCVCYSGPDSGRVTLIIDKVRYKQLVSD